jgi:ubiquitin-protein ligase
MSVRIRRLFAEHERLKVVFANHERIRIVEAVGRPPDRYVVEYHVKGLVEERDEIRERDVHRAEITLGADYPREMPRCVMLTPVFHPNIDHLAICTEDIGSAGQTLDETIIFIAEMISYQAYNLQSPRNGDAARWTQENLDRLPLENVNLIPPVLLAGGAEPGIAWAAAAAWWEARNASSAPVEAPDEPAAPPCANCGRSDPQAEVAACAQGHAACQDCRLTCANCGTSLCLRCPVERCAVCRELFCTDCVLDEPAHCLACAGTPAAELTGATEPRS